MSPKQIISPEVIYESSMPEIVHGKLFSADYMHIFNIQGFKTYAEEFIEWMSDDIVERSGGFNETLYKEYLRSNTTEKKLVRIPEIIINQFFIDKKFSMKYTGTYYEKLKYSDGTLTRNMTSEIDYYRALWYDWDNKMIKRLT